MITSQKHISRSLFPGLIKRSSTGTKLQSLLAVLFRKSQGKRLDWGGGGGHQQYIAKLWTKGRAQSLKLISEGPHTSVINACSALWTSCLPDGYWQHKSKAELKPEKECWSLLKYSNIEKDHRKKSFVASEQFVWLSCFLNLRLWLLAMGVGYTILLPPGSQPEIPSPHLLRSNELS